MRPTTFVSAFSALVTAALLTACGDPLSLPPASLENRIDTLKLYSVGQSPIHLPSAFVMVARQTARLDQLVNFDFVYGTDAGGGHYFLPFAAVAPTPQTVRLPGFLATGTDFDAITVAEQVGYLTRDTIPLTVGQVLYVRSAVDPNCGIGTPYYGKLHVLGFNEAEHAVLFRFLINVNCGYRGLELGLPKK
jgi:predicted small lipoprotein YifL